MRPLSLLVMVGAALALLVIACSGAPTATLTPTEPTAVPTRTPRPPTPTLVPLPPTATATPAPTVEAGRTSPEKSGQDFALTLPPTWKQIDLDPQTLEASLKAITVENPQMAALLEGQARSLSSSGFKYFALDFALEGAKTGFTSNVNVLKQPLPVEVSLEVYTQLNVGQLENTPAVVKPVSQRRIKLEAGDGVELRYRMNMNSLTGQATTLAITQYLTIKGKDAYVITLTTTADQAEKYAPTFEKIGQSFRFTR